MACPQSGCLKREQLQFRPDALARLPSTWRVRGTTRESAVRTDLFNPELSVTLAKVLIGDDDEVVRETLCTILQNHDFEVTCAINVSLALKFISSHKFDVLLSALHMPGAGDGLTVVSAMRHANPEAVTLLLNALKRVDKRSKHDSPADRGPPKARSTR